MSFRFVGAPGKGPGDSRRGNMGEKMGEQTSGIFHKCEGNKFAYPPLLLSHDYYYRYSHYGYSYSHHYHYYHYCYHNPLHPTQGRSIYILYKE
jgi:hypothetical protein